MADVLQSLSLETLEDLFFHDHPDARDEKKKWKRKEIIDALSDKLDSLAIEIFLASLPLAPLKDLATKAKAQFKDEDNKNSRSVVTRRLTEQVVAAGLDEFLNDTADAETLKAVAEDFDVKVDKKEIAETARALAAERYFSALDVESLRVLAEDLKLKNAAKSSSKRKLVDAIVSQEDADAPERPKKKKKSTDVGKKKPIEKGATYDEIFQHYYAEELRDYAKQKGIKISGKKPVLIKRILAYLDGNTEGIMAGEKTEPKKKKKAASSKKKKSGEDKKASGEEKKASASSKASKSKKADKEEKKEENGSDE